LELREKLAKKIYALRKERGWTQAEMASRLRIKQVQIAKWESGRYNLEASTLEKIARVFKIKITALF
jgi:transcriptional regulator with XRE-family HTH domain